MSKTPRVGDHEHYAIQRFAKNRTLAATAREFGRTIKTIRRVLKNPFQPTRREPSAAVKARRDAAKKMALKIDINPLGFERPAYPNSKSISNVLKVPARTIRRDLRMSGLKPYIRPRVSTLDKQKIKARWKFCEAEARKGTRVMNNTAFSDESLITCSQMYDDRSQYAEVREGVCPRESPNPYNTGGRLLVWATVGLGYKSPLVVIKQPKDGEDGSVRRLTAARYVRVCLSKVAPDLVRRKLRFMQDGARPHIAHSTLAYLKRKGIQVVDDWPAASPQLNIIEGLWSVLKSRIAKRYPTTTQELERAAKEEWDKIPQTVIDKSVRAYAKRIRLCKSKRGCLA